MRIRIFLTLALLLTTALPPTTVAHHAGLRITEILPDPASDREFVEFQNTGATALDLAGYTLRDAAGAVFTFPTWTLEPGRHVVVWGGGDPDDRGPAWSRASVWNNGGDTAQLHDPAGALIDAFAYGDHGTTPPASHPANATAPPAGTSLQWNGNAWVEGAPTPGAPHAAVASGAQATVLDVPPIARFVDAPVWAAPGSPLALPVEVRDPNGDDLVGWTLSSAGTVLAQGTDNATAIEVQAPAATPAWPLRLTATDAAGHTTNATHNLTVRDSPLRFHAAQGALPFPALVPGARNVTSLEPYQLHNDAPYAVTPRLDASPFRGIAAIPVDGNLHIGWDIGTGTTWMPYDGPLTVLPTLPPGASAQLWLRIDAVPDPLPAGTYGTTFTVVA